MAEVAAPAAEPGADAALRGDLDVRTKALRHLVEQASRTVPGTVDHQAGLRLGGGTPRAEVTFDGGALRVQVHVAAAWPARVTDLAAGVREQVRTEAERLTGLTVRSVDVTVEVVAPTPETTRRVR